MPKPMRLMVEVEEVAFGKVFRTLDTMPGVVSIKIMAEGPSNGGTPRGPYRTSESLLLEALKSGPKDRKTLENILVSGGKKPTTLNNALSKVVEAKKAKTNGKGTYTITEKGKGA